VTAVTAEDKNYCQFAKRYELGDPHVSPDKNLWRLGGDDSIIEKF